MEPTKDVMASGTSNNKKTFSTPRAKNKEEERVFLKTSGCRSWGNRAAIHICIYTYVCV